jgi:hypothetical protein
MKSSRNYLFIYLNAKLSIPVVQNFSFLFPPLILELTPSLLLFKTIIKGINFLYKILLH